VTIEDKEKDEVLTTPSLHLPFIGRSVILRALYAPIWKSRMLHRIQPQ